MDAPIPRRGLIATILVMMAVLLLIPHLAPRPLLQEGRVMAGPPAWSGLADLSAFRSQTDDWVVDRFPARPYLIGTLNYVRLQFGDGGTDRVVVGRDGWLFYNDGTRMGPARGENALDQAQAAEWLRGLSGRVESLRGKAIYLVVSPPAKDVIYPQFGPRWYEGPSPRRNAPVLTALAARTEPGHVIYLHDPVMAVARSGVEAFSRHDTHWTGDGAYAGYVAIMRQLQALGFDQGPRPLSDFVTKPPGPHPPRDLAVMSGVASFYPLDYRNYMDPKAPPKRVTWLSARRDWTAPQVVDTGEVGKPVLLMTRDSFSNALNPMLLGHFSRVILTHIDDGMWRQDLIDRFHPDVVMLEVQEHGLAASMSNSPVVSQEAEARIEAVLPKAPTHGPQAPSAPSRGRFVPVGRAGPTFAGLDAAVPTPGCNVDQALMDGRGLMVSGWISDLSASPGSGEGAMRLTGPAGDYVQPLAVDQPRPDVTAFFKRPIAQPVGFSMSLSVQGLPAGAYDVRIYRRTAAGWMGCAGPKGLSRP